MIRRIQLTLLALFVGVWAMASETSVKNADGVEIWYDFDSNTKTASVTYWGESQYNGESDYIYNDEYIGNVVIPSKVTYEGEEYSVTSIGVYAFYDCSSLTSITIPESVTEIGKYAFMYCHSLTSLTIPESVTEIGEDAFYDCNSLTSIDVALDNNCYTSINGVLFSKDKTILIKYLEGKKDVTSYAIPESVTSIEESAFDGCSSLTSITIPEGVKSIGEWAFGHCSSLTSITIPEGVTEIGGAAFCGCSSLTSITLPESVTSIEGSAFEYCSSLTSITIPKGVTEIGEYAFYNCNDLTSITSMNVTPPSIGNSSTFSGVDKSIPVYVPKQSVEAYKSAKYWDEFTNIQGIDDTPISDIQTSEINVRLIGNSLIVEGTESYAVYALSGQCLGMVESLERGVYIVVADGVSKRIVVK